MEFDGKFKDISLLENGNKGKTNVLYEDVLDAKVEQVIRKILCIKLKSLIYLRSSKYIILNKF